MSGTEVAILAAIIAVLAFTLFVGIWMSLTIPAAPQISPYTGGINREPLAYWKSSTTYYPAMTTKPRIRVKAISRKVETEG